MGPRILVVDESPHLGDVLCSALEGEGCRAEAARTPTEALRLLRSFAPDLVTIDVGLDGAINSDLVARMSLRQVPLIVIVPQARDISAEIADHAVRVFEKPFYPSHVVAAVLDTLGHRVAYP